MSAYTFEPNYNVIEINGHKYRIDPTDSAYHERFEAATTKLQKAMLNNGADLQAGKIVTSAAFRNICKAMGEYINKALDNPNATRELLGDNTSVEVALIAQKTIENAVIAAMEKRTSELITLYDEYGKRPEA